MLIRSWAVAVVVQYIFLISFTTGTFREQSVAVKGIVSCRGIRRPGAFVQLYDQDAAPLFDDDDLLGSVTADDRGVFCVRGYTTEVTDIDPYIYIEHNCGYEGLDQKHSFSHEIPAEFVVEGNYSKKIYHMGDIELLTRDAPVQHYQRRAPVYDHRQFSKLTLHQQILHCIPLYVAYKDYYERVVVVGSASNRTVLEKQAWDELVKTGPSKISTPTPAPGPPGPPKLPPGPPGPPTVSPAQGPSIISASETEADYLLDVTEPPLHYTEAHGYITPHYEDTRRVGEDGEEEQRLTKQESLEEEDARRWEEEEVRRREHEEQRRIGEERRPEKERGLEEERLRKFEEQRRLEEELRREERLRLEEEKSQREHENRLREERLREEEERRRLEEERRRLEEEIEEERRRVEEERRKVGEERRIAEERRLWEEEEMLNRINTEYGEQRRREEEVRREEQRLGEEQRRKEEEFRREEERRRNEELMKELEMRREEHKRRLEEFQKLEDQRREEIAKLTDERRQWKEKLKAAEEVGKKTQLIHIICYDGEVIRTPEARKELYTEGKDPCEEFRKN
uniref:Transthyretin-like family protein n=1 Tax=Haemonchus contortus TaxID=6289 RepID=A0A7I5EE27_HAECO